MDRPSSRFAHERGEFQMLLVFLGAIVATRERQNERIVAL